MNRKLILPALAALLVAALAVPSLARAVPSKVVLHRSIGGVGLGLTPDQVKHRLGKPSHTIKVSGKIAELQFDGAGINVEFDTLHHPVASDLVSVHKSRFHLSNGIHPGSTVAALKRAYRGQGLKRDLNIYTLYKGKRGATGSRRTDFGTLDGKVSTIDVQLVLDDL